MQINKRFLVLFFKKELLFLRLPSFGGVSLSMPVGISSLAERRSFKPVRRARSPHAAPIRSRGPKDGRQATNLVYASSSLAGNSILRHLLRQSGPSNPMGGRFDSCVAHHMAPAMDSARSCELCELGFKSWWGRHARLRKLAKRLGSNPGDFPGSMPGACTILDR